MADTHVSPKSAGSTWKWQVCREWRRFPSQNRGEHAVGGREEGGSEQQSETEENVELGDITHALCHSPPGKSESHDRVPPKSGAQAGRPPHCLEPPGRDDHYIRTQCWWGSLSRSWEISFRGPRRPVSNPTGRLPHLLRRELDLRLVRRTLNRQYKLWVRIDRYIFVRKKNLITLLITISS